MKSDEELIVDYQNGQDAGLEELFTRYKAPILNYALRILGQRADAEDVVIEVFMILVTDKMTYQPQAKFSTWLYRVAHNTCISRLRRRKFTVSQWFKKDDSDEFECIDVADTRDLPREELIQQETKKMVKKCIQTLPEDQRAALVLREYHDMSYEDISQTLGCSLENVKVLIFRAREYVKTKLASFTMEDTQ